MYSTVLLPLLGNCENKSIVKQFGDLDMCIELHMSCRRPVLFRQLPDRPEAGPACARQGWRLLQAVHRLLR